MATINNKLIHFKSKSDFNSRYEETTDGGITYGDFLGTSIVFIQDAKQIWTHGQFYDANEATLASLGITATAAELNKLDGVTATTQELNYVDGVTSNIQTQLNDKTNIGHTHTISQITDIEDLSPVYIIDYINLLNHETTGSMTSVQFNEVKQAIEDKKSIAIYSTDNISSMLLVMTSSSILDETNIQLLADVQGVKQIFTLTPTLWNYSREQTISDLSDLGVTATAAELNQLDGVTLSNYALKSDIPDISTLATKSELSNYLPLSGGSMTGGIDLSNATPVGTAHIGVLALNGKKIDLGGGFTIWDNGGIFKYGDHTVLTEDNWDDYITPSSIGAASSDQLNNYLPLNFSGIAQTITLTDPGDPYGTQSIQLGTQNSVLKETFSRGSATLNVTYSLQGDASTSIEWAQGDNTIRFQLNNGSRIIVDGNIVLTSGNYSQYISSTDTKNTTGTSNSTSKLYLVGGTSQDPTGVVTYSNSNVYTERGSMYAKGFYTIGTNNSAFVIDTMIGIVSSENRVASIGTTGIGTNKSIWVTSGVDDQATKTITLTGGTGTFSDKVNATNGFYETSDARLKNFKDDIKALEVVSEIPTKYFTWKKDEEVESVDPELHIGTSAQEIQKIYPDLVTENEEGELSVDYARLSVIALAAIKELKKEIDTLKSASVKYKF